MIRIRDLTDIVDDDGAVLSRARVVANLSTPATTMTVPSGLLETGKTYHFVLIAKQHGATYHNGFTPDVVTSSWSTGAFTP